MHMHICRWAYICAFVLVLLWLQVGRNALFIFASSASAFTISIQQSTVVKWRKEQMWEKIGTGKKEEAEEKSCIPGTRCWSSKLHWDLSLSEKGGAITYLSHTSLNSHASLIPLTYLSHDSLMTLSYLSHIPLTTLSDTSLIPFQLPLVASSKVCSERTPLLFFTFLIFSQVLLSWWALISA